MISWLAWLGLVAALAAAPVVYILLRSSMQMLLYYTISRRLDKRIARYPKFMGVLDTIGETENIEPMLQTLQRPDGSYEPLLNLGPFDGYPILLVQDANLLKTITTSSDVEDFPKHHMMGRLISSIVGNGIVTTHGAPWALRRKLVTPLFHFKSLKLHADTMTLLALQMVEKLRKIEEVDEFVPARKYISELTLSVIIALAFGNDFDVDWITKQYGEMLSHFGAFATQALLLGLPIAESAPLLAGRKIFAARAAIERRILDVIRERRDRLKDMNADDQLDLISLLILKRDDSGQGLSDFEITQECLTFMFAGYDTASSTLSWMLYFISKNRNIQEKLQKEVDTVLRGRAVTMGDLALLSFLRDCMRETLRLAPPAWIINREAKHDIDLNGYQIPKGCIFGLNLLAVGRDPRYWDDPVVFKPERWAGAGMASGQVQSEENEPSLNLKNRYAYIPFSAGARNCVGQKFAQQEIMLAMATLLQRFDIVMDESKQIKWTPEFTLIPGNLYVKFMSRQNL